MLWQQYDEQLQPLARSGLLSLPELPDHASHNAHIFYVQTQDLKQRDALLHHLNKHQIAALFHYVPLHHTTYFRQHYPEVRLPNAARYGETLIRLPLHLELSDEDIYTVVRQIEAFCQAAAIGG